MSLPLNSAVSTEGGFSWDDVQGNCETRRRDLAGVAESALPKETVHFEP